jgi:hypothetical protein
MKKRRFLLVAILLIIFILWGLAIGQGSCDPPDSPDCDYQEPDPNECWSDYDCNEEYNTYADNCMDNSGVLNLQIVCGCENRNWSSGSCSTSPGKCQFYYDGLYPTCIDHESSYGSGLPLYCNYYYCSEFNPYNPMGYIIIQMMQASSSWTTDGIGGSNIESVGDPELFYDYCSNENNLKEYACSWNGEKLEADIFCAAGCSAVCNCPDGNQIQNFIGTIESCRNECGSLGGSISAACNSYLDPDGSSPNYHLTQTTVKKGLEFYDSCAAIYGGDANVFTVEEKTDTCTNIRYLKEYKGSIGLGGEGIISYDSKDCVALGASGCEDGACIKACTNHEECNDDITCTDDLCLNSECSNQDICSEGQTCNTELNECRVDGSCTQASECDDSNSCTTDSCSAGACSNNPISGCCNSAADCSDGITCTNDVCSSNSCSNPNNCLNGQVCNPQTGSCQACTSGSECDSGICNSGTCVTSSCEQTGCDDGNSCTTDSCSNGNCIFNPVNCDDSNDCTTDSCELGGCINTLIPACQDPCLGVTCNDDNSCTTDSCSDGNCEFTPKSCDDGNLCTTDSCLEGACSNTIIPSCTNPCDNIICNDANPCTTDTCNNGNCIFETVDCNDGNVCTSDSCSLGQCINNLLPNCVDPCENIVCDDSSLCTTDTCNNGQCVFNELVCNDGNVCTSDSCSLGQCIFNSIANCNDPCENIVCNDNEVCTTDSCNNGQCVFTQIPNCGGCTNPSECNDNDDCTVDSCTKGACLNTQIENCGKACIFNSQCKGSFCQPQTCSLFQCVAKTPPECDDNDPCTQFTCSNDEERCIVSITPDCGSSCTSTFECDDGNSCTTDSCSNGNCQNIIIPNCGSICIFNSQCSGSFCQPQTCSLFQCVADPIPTCEDSNSCTEDSCNLGTDSCNNVPISECEGLNCNNNGICELNENCYGCFDCSCNLDLDFDGYFIPEDCNDNDENINPGMQEVCDGLDNNCDGLIDPGCSGCEIGDLFTCGIDVGLCTSGTQTCLEGILSICTGSTGPFTEICGDRLDQDCDGSDEQCLNDCISGTTRNCGSNIGECQLGNQICIEGQWGACINKIGPTTEICDNLDNNCDGTTDEGCSDCITGTTRNCGTGIGECLEGTQTCTNDVWSTCIGAINPISEICDNLDNNCDGAIDEGCPDCISGQTTICGINQGGCSEGIQTCTNEVWGACLNSVGPSTEICDSLDNNCNNQIDEGCLPCDPLESQTCGIDIGECNSGIQTCESSGLWGGCQAYAGPAPEICDGLDNDCDGSTDEGRVCDFNLDSDLDGLINDLDLDDNNDGIIDELDDDDDGDGISDLDEFMLRSTSPLIEITSKKGLFFLIFLILAILIAIAFYIYYEDITKKFKSKKK